MMSMSKNNQVIMVSPPMFVNIDNRERIACPGHACSYCHGNGYFWEDGIEPVKKPCPVCNGSGKLDAEITIEWKPSKR